jgi:hypothetical protein
MVKYLKLFKNQEDFDEYIAIEKQTPKSHLIDDIELINYVPPLPNYLRFIALESGTFKFSGNSINYSLDSGSTWVSLPSNTDTPTVQEGNAIMWKANHPTTTSSIGMGVFSSSGRFDVEGNSMSLIYDDDFEGKTSLNVSYAFLKLFSGCTKLVSAEKMELPATTVTTRGYESMFDGCTSLTTAPELPATTMTANCYKRMFMGCTSLTKAPDLPATTLANSCYNCMFAGCSTITTTPKISATSISSTYAFGWMFSACTSLISTNDRSVVKDIVITSSVQAQGCYEYMFYGCTALKVAPLLPSTSLAENCYEGMFAACTSLTTPSPLPSTSLQRFCYMRMYSGCTSLEDVPGLLAETLAPNCYDSMFRDCVRLNPREIYLRGRNLASSCYQNMFFGCEALTNAPQLPVTTLAPSCYGGMFSYCLSLTTAPSLPATTLAESCYYSMFAGCSRLTKSPVLSASTLVSGCYSSMFIHCTSLNTITCLATSISASQCTYNWTYRVASSGTFIKASSMSSWSSGNNGIPNGWTVTNA